MPFHPEIDRRELKSLKVLIKTSIMKTFTFLSRFILINATAFIVMISFGQQPIAQVIYRYKITDYVIFFFNI